MGSPMGKSGDTISNFRRRPSSPNRLVLLDHPVPLVRLVPLVHLIPLIPLIPLVPLTILVFLVPLPPDACRLAPSYRSTLSMIQER